MGNKKQNATSIGEMQRFLEAAQEHLPHVWGALRKAGLDTNEQMFTPKTTEGRKPGNADYHLAAVESYLVRALWGSYEFAGSTEGQLCPYEDCAHDLALYGEGWYMCQHCRRPLLCSDTDSDFEDYHVRRKKPDDVLPDNVPIARDLGPSWATPKEGEAES